MRPQRHAADEIELEQQQLLDIPFQSDTQSSTTAAGAVALKHSAPVTAKLARPMLQQRGDGVSPYWWAPSPCAPPIRRPGSSRVILTKTPGNIDIKIPPKGLGKGSICMWLPALLWALCYGLNWAWFMMLFASRWKPWLPLLFVAFWLFVYGAVGLACTKMLKTERFAILGNIFSLAKELAVLPAGAAKLLGQGARRSEGQVKDLAGARLITTSIEKGRPKTIIEVVEGVNKYRFGEGLALPEQQWLVYEINKHLTEERGEDVRMDLAPPEDTPKVSDGPDLVDGGVSPYLWASLPSAQPMRRPAGSRIILTKSPDKLDIEIPAKVLSGDSIAMGLFALCLIAVACVMYGVVIGPLVSDWSDLWMLLPSVTLIALFGLMGCWFASQALGMMLKKERFAIGGRRFRLAQELAVLPGLAAKFLFQGARESEGQVEDPAGARIITTSIVNGQPQAAVEVWDGHRFGEGLALPEQQWLVYEINKHLTEERGVVYGWAGHHLNLHPRGHGVRSYSWAPCPSAQPVGIPAWSGIILTKTPGNLDIKIPPKGLNSCSIFLWLFALAVSPFAVWVTVLLASNRVLWLRLFGLPLWFCVYGLVSLACREMLKMEQFAIWRSRFRLAKELTGLPGFAATLLCQGVRRSEGQVADLWWARVIPGSIEVMEGVHKHSFGERLSQSEKKWLVYEINKYLSDEKGKELCMDLAPPEDTGKVDDGTNLV